MRQTVVPKMQQDQHELDAFVRILIDNDVRAFLEVGSKFGGSLDHIARALPVGSRVVSVDLPWGDRSSQPYLTSCVEGLRKDGYDAHMILGDSTDEGVVEQARALGPYDAIFIDANHTEPFVRRDWASYGPMGRIIAFHDIGWIARPEPGNKLPIDVPKVWAEIRTHGTRYEEIKRCPRDNGIGVLWRY